MTHSKEPWKVTRKSGMCVYLGSADGRTIAIFGGYGTKQSEADARRVRDLVNTTVGISIQEVRRWAILKRRNKRLNKKG